MNDKSRKSVRAKGGRKIRETDQSCQASENEYCLGVYSIGGTSCLKHEASFARFCWVLSWGDVTATWNSRLLNPPVLDAWGYDVQMVSSCKKSSHCDSRPQIQDSNFKFGDYPAPSLKQSCYPLSHTHSTRIVSSTTHNFVSTELLPKLKTSNCFSIAETKWSNIKLESFAISASFFYLNSTSTKLFAHI